MTSYMLIIVFSFLVALLAATRADGKGPSLKVRTSEAIVATRNCDAKIPRATPKAYSPWKPHSRAFRRWQLNVWTKRLADCRAILARRAYEWNWQAWLPDKWRRVGVCETGLNWAHANSSYLSAFGISVREYDNDAAYMGALGWPKKIVKDWRGRPITVLDLSRNPSPWNQWQAAVGHYKRFGGFSGWGCRGA